MRTFLALGLVFGLAGFAVAQDKKADDKKPTEKKADDTKKDDKKADDKKADAKKGDVSGTWTWETENNGQKQTRTLTLKQDGDKLTGSMPGRNNTETKIEDGAIKDGEISFTVTRTMGDNKIVSKYKGKLDGDTLKLTSETERNGETQKREISAKKAEEKKDDKKSN